MSTVTATLKMFDAMTKPLQNITNSMNIMLRAMEDMQKAADRNVNLDRTLTAAKKQLASAEAEIRKSIDQATQAQQRFGQSVKNSNTSTNSLVSSIKRMAAGLATAYLSAQGIRAAIESADTIISTQARLDLIVDEGQSVEQLQDSIFSAAQRARGDFVAMSNSVAKLGLLADDAFKNNDEIVAFVETMQKAFKISGASIEEQTAGMYQLTQAMAAGKLQGDEFRSIMENAPMLADAIAKFTGKSKGELKELSADGKITADIIKSALFMAADDINKKFETLPKTFSDVWQQFKNDTFKFFEPVFRRLNEWLNSAQGTAFVQSLTNALYFAAQATDFLVGSVIWLINTIQSGWGIIEPILAIVTASLSLWTLTLIPSLVSRLWLMVQPILASAAAWALANWPILLVGAAIGFVIYALYRWGDVTAEVIGFVIGMFAMLWAQVHNGFIFFANTAISIAEFFANVWRDPIYSVKKMFYDLVINALQWLQNLANGLENILNAIPGVKVSLSAGITGFLGRFEATRNSLKSEADIVKFARLQFMDTGAAFKAGQSLGRSLGKSASGALQGIVNKIGDAFKMPGLDSLQKMAGLGKGFEGLAKLPEGIDKVGKVGEVGKIRDTVDISSEDLKVMRELAEMKAIQNFVTLQPQLTFGDTHIRQDGRTVEEIIANITERLQEEIASSAKALLT